MIKNATFVSVWDDGFEVASGCKVNTDTNKVFDIEQVCFDGLDLEILDMEYIGKDMSLKRKSLIRLMMRESIYGTKRINTLSFVWTRLAVIHTLKIMAMTCTLIFLE